MAFVEDTPITSTALEQQLIDGVSFPKLNRLLTPLKRSVLTAYDPQAAARRLVQLAASLETGALFDRFFSDAYLASEFRTKARLLDIDKALRPYYGLVLGAQTELRLASIDPAVTDMWIYHFRQDNGHYRATVVASMCVVGAFSDAGYTLEV